jgi:hypothetical protein
LRNGPKTVSFYLFYDAFLANSTQPTDRPISKKRVLRVVKEIVVYVIM